MENSMLKLSRSYEKGLINKETYRKRRAELIQAVLDQVESDRTITNRTYSRLRGKDELSEAREAEVEAPQRDNKMMLLVGGGVAALLLVLAIFVSLSNNDDEANQETVSTRQQQAPVNMEQIEVLKDYTNEILQDGVLDLDEMEEFVGQWTFAPTDEQERWQVYALELVDKARVSGEDNVVSVFRSLYIDLELPLPVALEDQEQGIDRLVVGSAESAESIEAKMPDEFLAIPDGSSQALDEIKGETAVNVEMTSESVAESAVTSTPIEIEVAQVQNRSLEADSLPAEIAETTSAQKMSEDKTVVAPPQTSSLDESLGSTSAASSETQTEKVTASTKPRQSLEAKDTPNPSRQKAVVASKVVPSKPRSVVNLTASFVPVAESGSELAVEDILNFLKDWSNASRQDKLDFTRQADSELLKAKLEGINGALETLERGRRHEALRRLASILRAVSKKQADLPTSSMTRSVIAQRPGENYTIQLFVSSSEARVRELIPEDPRFSFYYVKAKSDQAERYILLEGNYSREERADTRKLIVPQLGDSAPWVRTNTDLLSVMD